MSSNRGFVPQRKLGNEFHFEQLLFRFVSVSSFQIPMDPLRPGSEELKTVNMQKFKQRSSVFAETGAEASARR